MVRRAHIATLDARSDGAERRADVPANSAMDRYAQGDDGAFSELYDGLAPRLYGYLLRQTRNNARAEDLVQQTFLQMHCARGRFSRGADVVPWAFAIARRLLIDGVRRSGREVSLELREEAGAPPPVSTALQQDEVVHSKQLAASIERELARLPDSHREAFELIKEEGLSLAEAADVLGTTVAAVKLRAHRTYQALREALGPAFERSAK
jgi:RNA polymerase sigma-70 factor (ECF subfamily)